jgi:hypothetical protein
VLFWDGGIFPQPLVNFYLGNFLFFHLARNKCFFFGLSRNIIENQNSCQWCVVLKTIFHCFHFVICRKLCNFILTAWCLTYRHMWLHIIIVPISQIIVGIDVSVSCLCQCFIGRK